MDFYIKQFLIRSLLVAINNYMNNTLNTRKNLKIYIQKIIV